ncbi:FAD-dependent oxidoreductase [Parahaliea sp. F7430]|uniref:FAD-dependent oxidoreductase n=1 Tax=Sediminihaliea albiluteola TaxID=2758564 RepID=A0A7W2YI94_9GAMM|nr:FAD-dependent oxidoreductase [Sediminihaliea albiluteola]MBA6411815.1 FAD-dependent oxidoreductase [Sediminihaliea albiluteola]
MNNNAIKPWLRSYDAALEAFIKTDVLVCGYGGAGASAALEARRAGADVVVLERSSGGGGSTQMSSCEMYLGGSGGTALQQEIGLSDSTENMSAYLTEALGEHGDPERIRLYTEGAASHFEWVESLGVPYKRKAIFDRVVVPHTDESLLFTGNERAWPFTEVAEPIPRGHVPSHEGDQGGRIFMKALMEACVAAGVRVQVDSQVQAVVQDDSGRVRGVMAKIDGKERFIEATRGVVLSTGGFVMNRKMLEKHCAHTLPFGEPYGNQWDMGDGIQMGMAAGGNIINMDQCFISMAFYPPASLTYGILINNKGQRYINEDAYLARLGHYSGQQDKAEIYMLVQNEDFDLPYYLSPPPPLAATGDSIEEVEREAGLPEGALQATVDYYNKYAAQGQDPLFHKAKDWLKPLTNGPFALISFKPEDVKYPLGNDNGWLMFTLGGLETRPTGEVLTPSGQAIPGLYAAGRTTAGLPRTSKGYASGMSVGDATFFGRMAGRQAAANT